MSDMVPYYYGPLPVTRAARERKALAQQHQAEMDNARSEARVFEYRVMEGLDILNMYIHGVSRVDRNLSAACGDRPGLEMEMRTLIQDMNGAFSMANIRFVRGRA